jgi:hypothetical protein
MAASHPIAEIQTGTPPAIRPILPDKRIQVNACLQTLSDFVNV